MSSYSPEELRRRYKSLPKTQRAKVSEFVDQQTELAVNSSGKSGDARSASLTHRTTGRLVFDDGAGEPKPIHNITVELWDQDFGHHDYLGRGVTDHEGFFEIWYDPKEVGRHLCPKVQLRVYDCDYGYDSDGEVTHHDKLIYTFDGHDDVTHEHYDFGEHAVPYWTYDPHSATPRVHVVEHGSPPQSYSHGRATMLVKHVAHVEMQRRLHHLENKISRHLPTLNHIQHAYPESLTMRLEKERPGYTRSDEFFGQRILNGMSASVLDKDPTNPRRYWLHHHWSSYEQDNVYAMPNVDVWFELRDEMMLPVEIALQFRQRGAAGANAPLDEPLHFNPQDGERWLQAKRVARVSATLRAELDVHLAESHLNTEQYAIATFRNLRRSPLRNLLAPHLKEVILINRDADKRLLGDHGHIPRATAFTPESLNVRIRQTMGTLDWKNWRPRKILCEQHTYAKAAHLFWELMIEFIDWFFEQHRDEIAAHWYEVHRFSTDLVEHSVPMFLCGYLRGRITNDPARSIGEWFEPNERMDLSLHREMIDGEQRAIYPITKSDVCDDESLENMKQVCRYAIFHATFMHTWSNSRQHDDGGELLYSGLGLRYGDAGVFSPESDHSIAPSPDLATDQLWFAWLLSNSNYGFITRNEDRDIHPKLNLLLRERQAAFNELGVDINTIQSRINI